MGPEGEVRAWVDVRSCRMKPGGSHAARRQWQGGDPAWLHPPASASPSFRSRHPSNRSFDRYSPELVEGSRSIGRDQFVLDERSSRPSGDRSSLPSGSAACQGCLKARMTSASRRSPRSRCAASRSRRFPTPVTWQEVAATAISGDPIPLTLGPTPRCAGRSQVTCSRRCSRWSRPCRIYRRMNDGITGGGRLGREVPRASGRPLCAGSVAHSPS